MYNFSWDFLSVRTRCVLELLLLALVVISPNKEVFSSLLLLYTKEVLARCATQTHSLQGCCTTEFAPLISTYDIYRMKKGGGGIPYTYSISSREVVSHLTHGLES